MHASTFLIGIFVQVALAAVLPLPVVERDTPLSFAEDTSSQAPLADAYDWKAGYVSEFPIHSSCNATERNQISKGLEEAVLLAQHAKEHSTYFLILKFRSVVR